MFASDNELDCGYCAIGDACGVSRAVVALADPTPERDEGLSCLDMRIILTRLGRLGGYRFFAEPWARRPLHAWTWRGGCWIVLIRPADRAFGHYIVAREGVVFDSDVPGAAWLVETYPASAWRVIAWWRVTEADAGGASPHATDDAAASLATAHPGPGRPAAHATVGRSGADAPDRD